jgi:hypothetical protein
VPENGGEFGDTLWLSDNEWQWNIKLYVSVILSMILLAYWLVVLLPYWLVICYLVWLLVAGLLPC